MAVEEGRERQVIIDFARGLVQTANPLVLPLGAAMDVNNVNCHDAPVLSVRKGRASFDGQLDSELSYLGQFRSAETGRYELLIGLKETGMLYRWDGVTPWEELGEPMTPTFTVYGTILPSADVLILSDGAMMKKYDGITLEPLAGYPPHLRCLETHLSRVWGVEGAVAIRSSATGNPEDWTTPKDAGRIYIDNAEGQQVTAIKSFRNKLYVWTQIAFYVILGTAPWDYTVEQIDASAGCWSHFTVVECQGYLYWFGPEGVWEYYPNTLPRLVSKYVIGDIIADADPQRQDELCAGTDGEQYRLSLPGFKRNREIIFDPQKRSWWVNEDELYSRYLYWRRP